MPLCRSRRPCFSIFLKLSVGKGHLPLSFADSNFPQEHCGFSERHRVGCNATIFQACFVGMLQRHASAISNFFFLNSYFFHRLLLFPPFFCSFLWKTVNS